VCPHAERDQLLVTAQHLQPLSCCPEDAVDVAEREVVVSELDRRSGDEQD
jgi:hypothetical protein